MRKRLIRLLRRTGGRLGALWAFTKRASGKGVVRLKRTLKRVVAIRNLAQDRAKKHHRRANQLNARVQRLKKNEWKNREAWERELAQARKSRNEARRTAEKWNRVQFVYNRRVKRLKKKIKRRENQGGGGPQSGDYAPWMLNGNPAGPNGLDENLKPVVVYQVVNLGQYITDTYDCYCHASNSYHYYWNAHDGQVHAVDTAGQDMAGAQAKTAARFGDDYFAELLGPAPWHIFHGQRYNGQYPGHATHGHYATPR